MVQGLTEFLPISSTAHLLVVRTLLGHAASRGRLHGRDPARHAGRGLRSTSAPMWPGSSAGLRADIRAGRIASTPDSRLGWMIVLGTVPAVVVGFLFKKQLKETFFNLHSIAVVSIVFALLDARGRVVGASPREAGVWPREETEIGWLDAIWVGMWQACALMPGGSRSGTTISGGLFAGLTRTAAARFSFLLSLPVMLGAGLKELYDEYKSFRSPVPGGAAEPVRLRR